MQTKILLPCLLALVPLAAAMPDIHYNTDYYLGASGMDPTNTVVAGVMVCETGATPGVGGSCPDVTIFNGDEIVVVGNDASALMGGPALGICIDTAFDGVCRPENPDDQIAFVCSGAAAIYTGPPGQLAIFVMSGFPAATGLGCGSSFGNVDVSIWRGGSGAASSDAPVIYLH